MPPKKKLSKKERARLEAEQAELLRIEMEKEKQRKLEEERQRREIERQQAIKRQQEEIIENRKRRAQLKNSMAFFGAVSKTVEGIKAAAQEQCDWEKFMRCNGLPTASSPSDLRKYMHQWRSDMEERARESRNWLLRTDERTLLTHDANVPDLSRATLRKQQGNLGDVYARRITEVLGILSELDEAIADKQKPAHTTEDLQRLKTEIRVFLKEYLDEFTYKTMSHIERDMEIDRPGVYRHTYASEVCKSHIWTYSKDAQLSANPRARIGDQNQHNEVTFPNVDMEIQLPPTVTLPSSAMRGLWLNFDHLSDYCPSFPLKRPKSKQIDILYQTKKEWRKRKEILQNLIDECSLKSPVSALISQDESMASKKPKERNIDTDKIYMEYEEELNKAHKRAIGPEAYGLLDTDLNLRKYRIISGVYCIDHLETPEQDKRLNARSFIRTIVAPDRLSYKSFFQTYKPPPAAQPGVRRLPEEIEAEMRMIEAALDKLALMTVQLPDSVIWFEPPVACRWETQMDTLESDLTEGVKPPQATATPTEMTPLSTTNPSPLKSSPRFPARVRKRSSGSGATPATPLPVREVDDFDMLNMPRGIDIYGLLKDFVVPRLPSRFTVKFRANGSDTTVNSTLNGGGGAPERKQKVLFVARHKNVSLMRADDLKILYEAQNEGDTAKATAGDANKSQPPPTSPLALLRKVNIDEDYLDLDEPREFFPTVKLKKALVFRPQQQQQHTSSGNNGATQRQQQSHVTAAVACGSSDNVNGNGPGKLGYASGGPVAANGHSNGTTAANGSDSHSRRTSDEKFPAQRATTTAGMTARRTTYMFSELLEDLDRLVGLQQPVQVEALNQISANLTSAGSSTAASVRDDIDEAAEEVDVGEANALEKMQAAFAAYMPGISFLRDIDAKKEENNEADTGHGEDDDSSSAFEDDGEDEELCKNDDNTEMSPGRGQGGVHDFLSKHNHSESEQSGSSEDKRYRLSSVDAFKNGKWSTRDVHDQKFNEDKFSIQFRTGRLGIFGFALNRYSNMPYQTWETKPDFKAPNTILFSFTASIVSLEITISAEGYCVNSFQGGNTEVINNMIGNVYGLEELKSILISSAVDIFPDEDAFCYTEGSCEKNYVMEMHLYACISTLGLSHNFSWSRWNLLAGNRTVVLLMRELIEGKKVPYHSTLLVTPLKTSIIDCTEVSASFNCVGIAGMEYYADLYQLSQDYAQPSSLEKQRRMDPMLRDNVARLLMAIRPLSFC